MTFPCKILSVLDKESFKVSDFFFNFVCFFLTVQHFSKTDYIQIDLAGLLQEIIEECKEDTRIDESVYLTPS